MTAKYICWQPLLTDHQAYTYEALRQNVEGGLVVNLGRLHDAVRTAQGWVTRGGAEIEKRAIPEHGWLQWAKEELNRNPNAVHVFGSPFEQFRQIQIMAMACHLGYKVVLISEPFSTNNTGYLSDGGRTLSWIKAKLRPVLYRAYGLYFGRRVNAVFAISPLACQQYEAIGTPKDRIFPFGYFVPSQVGTPVIRQEQVQGKLSLVFIASLIARKGLSIALDAVRRLRSEGYDITLDVYGAGNPDEYDFSQGITYKGIAAFGSTGEIVAGYDALVLPSMFDGWAVVVNEALQAGTPVCCSDAVGAGAVVQTHRAGAVFPSGDVIKLVKVLREWAEDRALLVSAHVNALRVAPLLEPVNAAHYFQEALASVNGNGERPASPWYDLPGKSQL